MWSLLWLLCSFAALQARAVQDPSSNCGFEPLNGTTYNLVSHICSGPAMGSYHSMNPCTLTNTVTDDSLGWNATNYYVPNVGVLSSNYGSDNKSSFVPSGQLQVSATFPSPSGGVLALAGDRAIFSSLWLQVSGAYDSDMVQVYSSGTFTYGNTSAIGPGNFNPMVWNGTGYQPYYAMLESLTVWNCSVVHRYPNVQFLVTSNTTCVPFRVMEGFVGPLSLIPTLWSNYGPVMRLLNATAMWPYKYLACQTVGGGLCGKYAQTANNWTSTCVDLQVYDGTNGDCPVNGFQFNSSYLLKRQGLIQNSIDTENWCFGLYPFNISRVLHPTSTFENFLGANLTEYVTEGYAAPFLPIIYAYPSTTNVACATGQGPYQNTPVVAPQYVGEMKKVRDVSTQAACDWCGCTFSEAGAKFSTASCTGCYNDGCNANACSYCSQPVDLGTANSACPTPWLDMASMTGRHTWNTDASAQAVLQRLVQLGATSINMVYTSASPRPVAVPGGKYNTSYVPQLTSTGCTSGVDSVGEVCYPGGTVLAAPSVSSAAGVVSRTYPHRCTIGQASSTYSSEGIVLCDGEITPPLPVIVAPAAPTNNGTIVHPNSTVVCFGQSVCVGGVCGHVTDTSAGPNGTAWSMYAALHGCRGHESKQRPKVRWDTTDTIVVSSVAGFLFVVLVAAAIFKCGMLKSTAAGILIRTKMVNASSPVVSEAIGLGVILMYIAAGLLVLLAATFVIAYMYRSWHKCRRIRKAVDFDFEKPAMRKTSSWPMIVALFCCIGVCVGQTELDVIPQSVSADGVAYTVLGTVAVPGYVTLKYNTSTGPRNVSIFLDRYYTGESEFAGSWASFQVSRGIFPQSATNGCAFNCSCSVGGATGYNAISDSCKYTNGTAVTQINGITPAISLLVGPTGGCGTCVSGQMCYGGSVGIALGLTLSATMVHCQQLEPGNCCSFVGYNPVPEETPLYVWNPPTGGVYGLTVDVGGAGAFAEGSSTVDAVIPLFDTFHNLTISADVSSWAACTTTSFPSIRSGGGDRGLLSISEFVDWFDFPGCGSPIGTEGGIEADTDQLLTDSVQLIKNCSKLDLRPHSIENVFVNNMDFAAAGNLALNPNFAPVAGCVSNVTFTKQPGLNRLVVREQGYSSLQLTGIKISAMMPLSVFNHAALTLTSIKVYGTGGGMTVEFLGTATSGGDLRLSANVTAAGAVCPTVATSVGVGAVNIKLKCTNVPAGTYILRAEAAGPFDNLPLYQGSWSFNLANDVPLVPLSGTYPIATESGDGISWGSLGGWERHRALRYLFVIGMCVLSFLCCICIVFLCYSACSMRGKSVAMQGLSIVSYDELPRSLSKSERRSKRQAIY